MESIGISEQFNQGFKHYWLVLKRRWLPGSMAFTSVFTIVILATFVFKKPIYLAQGMLKFERTSPTSSLTGVGKEVGNLEPLVDKGNPLETEGLVIRSNPVIDEAMKKLNLRNQKGLPLKRKEFLRNLDATAIKGADIIQVSYKDTKPKQASVVVNTVMNVYLQNNILAHRSWAVAARKFIEKQLPKAEAEVAQAEETLRQFKEKKQVSALKEEAAALVSIRNNIQQQITAIQSQIADTNAQAGVLRQRLQMDSQQAISITALSQSPAVQDILKEVQQTQSELAVEQSRFQDANPRVISLKEKLASLNKLLQDRINQVSGNQTQTSPQNIQAGTLQQELTKELVLLEGKRQGLSQQIATLTQALTGYEQRISLLPQLEKTERQLERRVTVSQATYLQLLQKIGEIRVAENQNVGNARIISFADVPDQPTSSKKFSVLAAILLGLIAATATTYILELLDTSIKTVEQARQIFRFTVLGVIPFYDQSRKASADDTELEPALGNAVIKDGPTSGIDTAYRILQANLKFLSSDKPIKVIVVSSSVPQEGKSTVSANLAAVIAQLGRRTLLIDADMRCPIQHRIWDLHNSSGLSNMLVEQTEPEHSIRQVTQNLDVLVSGVVPPNSMALLDSQRMAALIKKFSADYDYVIIDTPPLTSATDALILGKMADGILMVVRPGKADVGSATFARSLLTQSGQNVLGQVVNGVIVSNEPHSHYYFVSDRYAQGNLPDAKVPNIIAHR